MAQLHSSSSSSSSLGKDSTMASGAKSSVPVTELFWSLLDKADRKFSKLRDLPSFSRHSKDADFHKAFRIYTKLWRLQQEHRRELLDAGLKRPEIGEVAARIAQLYYGQYQRTSDSSYLSEAFAFYEAVLDRDYFKGGEAPAASSSKKLRFLVRFLVVAVVSGRREMVSRLADVLRVLVGECKKSFQEAESKEWKYVLQEVDRFLRADSLFMNMRPLRYSFVYDSHPYSFTSVVPCNGKRSLVLHDALLSSYWENEVKFTGLTLNTFRMLQSLEWELRGFVSFKGSADGSFNGRDPNRVKPLQDIKDPSLRPNPWKVILYRPTVTHLLMALSTICEELPPDGILLIYLSASGEGTNLPMTLRSGIDQDSCDIISERSDHDTASSASTPTDSPIVLSSHNTENHKNIHDSCLWLGSRGSKGSKYLYPSDLIPFTRKPLFLVIDSNNSHAFKVIHGAEKGETSVMLLSPSAQAPPMVPSNDSTSHLQGNQFTMFLTAPVQAFCFLIGVSGVNFDKDTYGKAEKLLSLSLSEWETALVISDSLHPTWAEVLGDPFLRRLILRFIFCRAVLALYSPTIQREKFLPSCLPHLPDAVSPEKATSQSAVLRLAEFFGATKCFA